MDQSVEFQYCVMAPGTTFVHDFAGVDRPVEDVLAAIHGVLAVDSVRELVRRAWSQEAAALDANGGPPASDDPADVTDVLCVESGPPRVRRDAMVVPVSWSGGEQAGFPPLECDLEFTAFGHGRTHIHLYGRSAISQVAQPGSQRGSLTNRVAVAVVSRFLGELVDELDRAIASGVSGRAAKSPVS